MPRTWSSASTHVGLGHGQGSLLGLDDGADKAVVDFTIKIAFADLVVIVDQDVDDLA